MCLSWWSIFWNCLLGSVLRFLDCGFLEILLLWGVVLMMMCRVIG